MSGHCPRPQLLKVVIVVVIVDRDNVQDRDNDDKRDNNNIVDDMIF